MTERMKRREFLRRAGIGIGTLAAAQALPGVTRRIAFAQNAGTLTYGMNGGFDTLDVNVTTFTRVGRIGLHLVDPLVWQVRPGQFAPGLATSWTSSPDAAAYTFKLRNDVKFHDGTPLTAEAAEVTFDRIKDPGTKSQNAYRFIGPYDRTEVLDPSTVRVRFKSPHASFLDGASSPYLGIISPTALKKYGRYFCPPVFGWTGPYFLECCRSCASSVLGWHSNFYWACRGFC